MMPVMEQDGTTDAFGFDSGWLADSPFVHTCVGYTSRPWWEEQVDSDAVVAVAQATGRVVAVLPNRSREVVLFSRATPLVSARP